jgi:Coatomer gamma subunit appendage platform subdomain
LKFVVKDCDPTTGLPDSDEGYDDEYMLEDFEITVADQIQKTKVNNFAVAWDSADSEGKIRSKVRVKGFHHQFNLQNGLSLKILISCPL